MAYGTFIPEAEGEERAPARRSSQTNIMAAALVGMALVGVIASVVHFSQPLAKQTAMLQQARQQQLAWSGFTYAMQDEADKALRLCSVGLLGPNQHCAKHVVPVEFTKYTHSNEGQNVWAENQRELNVQSSVKPTGEGDIGTPGDFGDRR